MSCTIMQVKGVHISEHPLPVCFKLFKSNRFIMGNNQPKVLIVYKIFALVLKSLMILY